MFKPAFYAILIILLAAQSAMLSVFWLVTLANGAPGFGYCLGFMIAVITADWIRQQLRLEPFPLTRDRHSSLL